MIPGNKDGKKSSSYTDIIRELSPYMNIGMQFVVAILLGVFAGKWLDAKFNTSPVWIVTLSLFGIIISITC